MKVAFTMILCMAMGSVAFAQSWDELNEKVKQLTYAESYAEAIPIAKQALALAKQQYGRSEQYAASLNNLSTLYRNMDSLETAEKMMVECVAVVKELSSTSQADYLVCLDNLALVYRAQNKYAKTETVLLEMAALTENKNDNSYLDIQGKLIVLYSESGEHKKAEQAYLKKAAAYLKMSGVQDSYYAAILMQLGNLYREIKSYVKADSIFKFVRPIITDAYGKDSEEYSVWANNAGLLYNEMDKFAEAEVLLLEAKELKRKFLGTEDEGYLTTLFNLGLMYLHKGDYIKAEKIYLDAHAGIEKAVGRYSEKNIAALSNIAMLYQDTERFNEAEKLSMEALRIADSIEITESRLYSQLMHNLGDLYTAMGYYSDAEKFLLKESVFIEKTFGKAHVQYAHCLNGLANLYSVMGQAKKSLDMFVEAAEIIKSTIGENNFLYAAALNNMAAAAKGDPDFAELAYIRSMEIVERLNGKSNAGYLSRLGNLGALYLNVEKYEEAGKAIKEAYQLSKEIFGESSLDFAYRCLRMGNWLEASQQDADAEKIFLKALNIARNKLSSSNPEICTYLITLAGFYAMKKEWRQAIIYLDEASDISVKSVLNNISILSEKEKLNFVGENEAYFSYMYSFIQHYPLQGDSIHIANFNRLLLFKSLSLTDSKTMMDIIRNSKDVELLTIYNDWLSGKAKLAKQYTLPVEERVKDLPVTEASVNSLEKELGRKSDAFKSLQQQYNTTIRNVQSMLEEDEVAIEFLKFGYYDTLLTDSILYGAYLLRKNDAVPFFIPLCSEVALDNILNSASVADPGSINKLYRGTIKLNNQTEKGDKLFNLIWKPLEPYLGGIKKVSFSPAGKLYGIAFHALKMDSVHFLMDRYLLKQTISTREIAFRKKEETNKISGAILFGNPAYTITGTTEKKEIITGSNPAKKYFEQAINAQSYQPWPGLEGTAKEVEAIQALFRKKKINTTVYLKESASEENFKLLSGHSPSVLHLATHGFFLPQKNESVKDMSMGKQKNSFELSDDPLIRSGLVLAGANVVWTGQANKSGAEDGILTGYEISQLNLAGTDLVVLSACETALGQISESEGVFGMQRAFKQAGVKNMLLSLWQVPDMETSEMMDYFYEAWLSGKKIDEALDIARMIMRKKYSPYYWAAFTLVE